ncbi:MAG: bifunctional diaminohydroxyphosphoribosylaminopyrimidine deaminase/5-amino-6-(5-phosphoribosylamino)uracil reductase RibD [Bacteroidota bacterium]|nr:bifunctional diaminohydroxyphosphoribosylaminopyrimidine deaminase/5-amino-6-(5-phosphoribosylamino)uracil reductase RibD [Bacteroidota bacterium]MDX5430237.1 bifunctional diaminohydroxyphosphoribosylaminopyrimidine deaminase/5-amino-6-(5-phosphoribosylamino)uracil reductase RibD [Bacteroidota bacterium]MDX5468998.1 bifunctional diaminohydroxyphosphoribosylaminopyrimidine deaminase/5-amino-6-(5-phosphoribosylamino)uracil reductase RibD [Bacteroidota bacterium]
MISHERYIKRCLELAAMGFGHTQTNPMVGCVIVHEGNIIGEGYHQRFGEAHAEVNAIASVQNQDLLRGATVYVSLEPCAHHGKTPPCCDLLINKGVKEVVIAMQDPFPKVDGEGIRRMKAAGIKVESGFLEEEAQHLNRRFITYHLKKRPFIILKWAQSEDGFIGTKGEKRAITHAWSQRLVHQWRGEEAAILIGPETAINDDPSLNNRFADNANPIRVLLDRKLRVPKNLKLFQDGNPLWVMNTQQEKEEGMIRYLKLPEEDFLTAVLRRLYEEQVVSMLVEGGAGIHQEFLKANLWDELRIGVAPIQLGEGVNAPNWPIGQASVLEMEGDTWYTYFNPAS